MAIKVVIKQTNLPGSNADLLQRVAVVYVNGEEYRVSAPPEAIGDALEWKAHFSVQRTEGIGSGSDVTGANRVIAIRATWDELQRLKDERPTVLTDGEKDDLLPLFRRKVFDQDLASFTDRALQESRPLCLLMMDLDRFKRVNDEYGHVIGDEVLLGCGKIIARQIERKGKAYRYGGEEMAALLPNFSAVEGKAVAETLRRLIELTPISSELLKVTISIGVACLPEHAKNAKELISHADQALYQAKKLGRNVVHVCEGCDEGADAEALPSVSIASALGFEAFIHEADYPPDTIIAGLEWRDHFVDVRLDIRNTVGVPIYNVDLQVKLDTSIAGIGQLSQFNDVEWNAETFGTNPISLSGESKEGKPVTIPFVSPPGTQIEAQIYRIRCGKITPGSTVRLLMASVALNPPLGGKLPDKLFATKRNPALISVQGYYESGPIEGEERYSAFFQREF